MTGLADLAASRTSAGTTELVEASQSAFTLLLSTFCCWARQYMYPDSLIRIRKMSAVAGQLRVGRGLHCVGQPVGQRADQRRGR